MPELARGVLVTLRFSCDKRRFRKRGSSVITTFSEKFATEKPRNATIPLAFGTLVSTRHERAFAMRTPTLARTARASKATARLAVLLLFLAARDVRCTAYAASEAREGKGATLAIRLPPNPRCPWLSEGIVAAARASPLVRAIVSRTRMAAPFGPGSWPDGFQLPDDESVETDESDDEEGLLPKKNPAKFGWTDAVVFSSTVRVDRSNAQKWLPSGLLKVRSDTARLFVAWYPDSFCCGPYHEIGVVLDVTHVPSGAGVSHCPWMLVDSDRSLIAGREILGFPKKLGKFSFRVNGKEVSELVSSDVAGTAKALDDVLHGAGEVRIEALATRGGVVLVNVTGTIARDSRAPDETAAFANRADASVTFLNVQTNHPLPATPDENERASETPSNDDPACLSNRPRLVQFAFREIPTQRRAWFVRNLVVFANETKTDRVGFPFVAASSGSSPRGTRVNGKMKPLEVLGGTFSLTNLYTGNEPTPTMGQRVPHGYLENDDVYWLRYQ
jgi:hypothetical protein